MWIPKAARSNCSATRLAALRMMIITGEQHNEHALVMETANWYTQVVGFRL